MLKRVIMFGLSKLWRRNRGNEYTIDSPKVRGIVSRYSRGNAYLQRGIYISKKDKEEFLNKVYNKK